MHNAWLVLRREYLERVRSRAFVAFTVLIPLFMYAIIILPSKLMIMKPSGVRHVVVVSDNPDFAQRVVKEISEKKVDKDADASKNNDDLIAPKYTATIESSLTDATRTKLNAQIDAGTLDGYLWLEPDVITTRKFKYYTKNASDFVESEEMRSAVRLALTRMGMARVGVAENQVEELLKGVDIDTLRVEKGKVSSSGGMASFFLPLMLMMMIYMTVIIYGVAVMRSVIEEKTSRVVEVLLSSVSSMELMAGKILGVGAVGFTQVLIWATFGAVIGSPAVMAVKSMLKDVHLPIGVVIAFPVFFLLGYLLYSTMYAAVGAMVNSDEEAQQMQWPVLAPLVSCAVFASMVVRTPGSPLAQALSIFPLTSPIIMFVRITVATPPAWQIALSVGLLIATIYGMVALCSRIYRVGILMYGKRPTLPEILKWIKYA
jgi:ABC-2 type transport system permease protein